MEEVPKSRSSPPVSSSAPWLVFFHGRRQKSQTFFSLSEGRFYVRSIRELRKNTFKATPQGWLLMLDSSSRPSSLLNPTTLTEIELPATEWSLSGYNCKCILSLPPTDPNCKVMCADFKCNRLLFCHPGDDKWAKHDYDLGQNNLEDVVTCNGKFYALELQGNITVIDFAPHLTITIVERERPRRAIGLFAFQHFLLESCGEIFRVMKYMQGWIKKTVHIFVYKMDLSKKAWDIVGNIGDRVFFLDCYNFSASWSASELGVDGNCIYFTMHRDECLYVFDLEDGTISTHLPCPNVRNPWSPPMWIVPVV